MLNYYRHGRKSGRIEAGQIVYLVPDIRPMASSGRTQTRDPWIVEGFATRTYAAARRGVDGRWVDSYMANGHLIHVRSLRTGRAGVVADWIVERSAA